jgi:hypothetical protein
MRPIGRTRDFAACPPNVCKGNPNISADCTERKKGKR